MKNNLDWFEHGTDAHENGKFMMLLVVWGPAGYGSFWILHEIIAQQDGCWLDLDRADSLFKLASRIGTDTDALVDFINFLTDKKKCGGLLIREGNKITSSTLQESLVRANKRRELERERKRKIKIHAGGGAENGKGGAENEHTTLQNTTLPPPKPPEGADDEKNKVWKKLVKWLSGFKEVENPNTYGKSLWQKYDFEVIRKTLGDSSCISLGKFSACAEHYKKSFAKK